MSARIAACAGAMFVGAALATACGTPVPSASVDVVPAGEPGRCATCHLPEYQAARSRHTGKPPTCAVCHAETGWHPATIRHGWWPLDGAHAKTECLQCHRDSPPIFHGNPSGCVDCHRKEYDEARDHASRPTTCDDCHTTSAWKPATENRHKPR